MRALLISLLLASPLAADTQAENAPPRTPQAKTREAPGKDPVAAAPAGETPVCAIPLVNVLPRLAAPEPMPTHPPAAPERFRMPVVRLPAPPCSEARVGSPIRR